MGYRVVLYPVTLLRIAMKAAETALTIIASDGTQRDLLDLMQTREELYELIKYDSFEQRDHFEDGKEDIFIRNLKIAEGGLDLRDQLLKDGTVSTNGILFQVNSAYIQPESYGVIRQIALAMEENTTMKLNIIGHTDSDGSDADNLSLSQQRAEAVKTALVNDFNIPADRLSVEGKGESQPIAGNESPEDKAANRRVEFVSL
jgi:outer membrane protein OmpA-like peptidoglycan-associated protein